MNRKSMLIFQALAEVLGIPESLTIYEYCKIEFSQFVPTADRINYVKQMMDIVRSDGKIKGYVWVADTDETVYETITILVW